MSKDNGWRPGCGTSILLSIVGIGTLVAMFRLGPVDSARTVYNQVFGDTRVLRRELVDYTRRDVQRKAVRDTSQGDVEKVLAYELGTKLEDGRVNPENVSLEKLWDASEDHARSWYQRWVWPSLDAD